MVNMDADASRETVSVSEPLTPVTLPCGRVLSNRMVKAAMYEHMASLFGGPPTSDHLTLYSTWAQGNWSMILTGNVQVSADHLSLGRDLVVPEVLADKNIAPFKQLACAIHGTASNQQQTPLAIMQLSHTGRQSANIIGGRWPFVPPRGPSAIGLNLGQKSPGLISSVLSRLMFQTPKEMTPLEIQRVVNAFVMGALLALKSGFDGVELHAGHGYLIAEFISPESNKRTDTYSAVAAPLHFLQQIVFGIRTLTPRDFVLGIKLNAADYVEGEATDDERVLQHIRDIASWQTVDFIEISGGTYEHPEFMNHSGDNTSRRQALFSRFSQRALKELITWQDAQPNAKRPLILLSGGLRSLDLMTIALRSQHADLLGMGRLSILNPHLPRLLTKYDTVEQQLSHGPSFGSSSEPWMALSSQPSGSFGRRLPGGVLTSIALHWGLLPALLKPCMPKLIGAGTEMAWFTVTMRCIPEIARGDRILPPSSGLEAIIRMWLYASPGPWNFWKWSVIIVFVAIVVAFLLF